MALLHRWGALVSAWNLVRGALLAQLALPPCDGGELEAVAGWVFMVGSQLRLLPDGFELDEEGASGLEALHKLEVI